MERKIIGQRLPRVDAAAQVTGAARFGADIRLPGTLYARVLRSPHPHARIKRLDCSRALALEGVMAVITADDLPTTQVFTTGGEAPVNVADLRKLLLAGEKVIFHGQGVAAVAAISPHLTEEALDLIDVEYEPLPPVLDPLEAMKPGALLLHRDLFTKTLGEKAKEPSNIAQVLEMGRGDVEAGFAQADIVLEDTFTTQMVHQGYIEPQGCTVRVEPGGRVLVWTSTQGAFNVRDQLASLFNIPRSRIRVTPTEVGGGFGGKLNCLIEPLALLLSQKTGRPVKLVLTREEVLRATNPGAPAIITIKTGAKKDGTLTALSCRLVLDAGCLPGAPLIGASLAFASYKVPNLKLQAYDVATNKPKVGAYRAPGTTQATFALESHMDMLAQALGIDPLELRRKNASAQGDPMPHDRPFNRIGLKELLERVSQHPAWTIPLPGEHRGRGLAVGFWIGGVMTSSAHITLNDDTSLSLLVGSVDLTGSRTSLLQIASEELQTDPREINVTVADTDSISFTEVSGGSRITYSMGTAVHRACRDLLRQLRDIAAEGLKVPAGDLEYRAKGFFSKTEKDKRISLEEMACNLLLRRGPVTGRGVVTRLQPAPAFACHVADVAVDPETGQVRLLKYTCFQDVGTAINPMAVEGQLQGGAAQGIGWALMEGYSFQEGALQNPSLLDYRMPTAADLPYIGTVLVEVPASDGPYGVRGVGEAPIVPPPAAIANAIYNAVGVRMKKLPMTPEAIFWAMKEKALQENK